MYCLFLLDDSSSAPFEHFCELYLLARIFPVKISLVSTCNFLKYMLSIIIKVLPE